MVIQLEILNSFTRYPGPRYRLDGPYSGEQFREEVLEPAFKQAIKSNDHLNVILDGVSGFGSSFLEESFGGLVRSGFSGATIEKHLNIVANTPRFEHHRIRAEKYISDALKAAYA